MIRHIQTSRKGFGHGQVVVEDFQQTAKKHGRRWNKKFREWKVEPERSTTGSTSPLDTLGRRFAKIAKTERYVEYDTSATFGFFFFLFIRSACDLPPVDANFLNVEKSPI